MAQTNKKEFFHISQLHKAEAFKKGESDELTATNLAAYAVTLARKLASPNNMSNITQVVNSDPILSGDISTTEAVEIEPKLDDLKAAIIKSATVGHEATVKIANNKDFTPRDRQEETSAVLDKVAEDVITVVPEVIAEGMKQRQVSANLQQAYDFCDGKTQSLNETQVRSYVKDFIYHTLAKSYDLNNLRDDVASDPILSGKFEKTEAAGLAEKMPELCKSLVSEVTKARQVAIVIANDPTMEPVQKGKRIGFLNKNVVFNVGKHLLSQESLDKIDASNEARKEERKQARLERNAARVQTRQNVAIQPGMFIVESKANEKLLHKAIKAFGGSYLADRAPGCWQVPKEHLADLSDFNIAQHKVYASIVDMIHRKELSADEKAKLCGIKAEEKKQSVGLKM